MSFFEDDYIVRAIKQMSRMVAQATTGKNADEVEAEEPRDEGYGPPPGPDGEPPPVVILPPRK
jgi:hypothetical protein